MSKRKVKRMRSWSFSKLMNYETCPSKIHFKYNERFPEEKGQAATDGDLIHLSGERFVKKETKILDVAYNEFKEEMADLRKRKAVCELEMAFTEDWIPTEYSSRDAWLRMKPDVMYVAGRTYLKIIDYKSGKPKEEHDDQLELYAVGGLIMNPGILTVTPEIYYLKFGYIQECHTIHRDQLEELKAKWTERALPMFNDKRLSPRPGWYCKFCSFSSVYKAGPCQF